MSLPTLFKAGSLLPQNWMTEEQKKSVVITPAIKWIINYVIERSWNKLQPPKIPIRGLGSRVGVFRSGTGTGKSTVFPPALYNEFFEKRGVNKNIICTQPTVATATDIPYQIEMFNKNLIMGQTIGYQTGNLVRKPIKGVLFATIGILLQHLKLLTDEEFMKKYSFIIIDEIHNRAIETDLTLFYLKRLLSRNFDNPDCPYVILTSGTFDEKIYMEYFECPEDSFLDIVGSSFPIEDRFTKFDVSDWFNYVVDLTEKLHVDNVADIVEDKLFRDILIFVSGGGQIKKIRDAIHLLNTKVFSQGIEYAKKHSETQQKKYKLGGKEPKTKTEYYICPISVMSEDMQKGAEDYQNLFSNIATVTVPIYEFTEEGERTEKIIKYVPASRRVMIGTNAVETGLTIDTLRYCIDTGMVNESQFNPNFGAGVLANKNVTQASSRQRRGRVGRKDPGVFHACYTKETYDKLQVIPFPEIIKADITNALLDIIISETETTLLEVSTELSADDKRKGKTFEQLHPNAFQMNKIDQRWYELETKKQFNAKSLDFIQFPAADSIGYGVEKLQGLGFIDNEYKPTLFGWFGSKFRKVKLENVRMILAGYHNGANVLDLITIACFLEAGHALGIKKKKYTPRNPLNLSPEVADQYFTMIIADEFVEYLFIWDDFMKEVDGIVDLIENATSKKSKNKKLTDSIMTHLADWAEKNSFDHDTLVHIINARDELICDLLTIGMNPFYNGLSIPRGGYNLVKILSDNLSEGLDEIRKIKQCIYEGYRFNLHIWNDGLKAYVSNYAHNPVVLDSKILRPLKPDDDIKQLRPQKIIVSSSMITASSITPGLYTFSGADVSVLDGFVDVDVEFLNR